MAEPAFRRAARGAVLLLLVATLPLPAVADATATVEDIVQAVIAGTDPAVVAAGLDKDAAADPALLNAVRLRLKAEGRAPAAQHLLTALTARVRSDAVLYNLALSYVDQLPGHNLLNKGYLSTASVRTVDEILQQRPDDWLALHIRGLNNLYWPDWFNRAPIAATDLGRAVAAGQARLTELPDQDGLAQSYLAQGDALALLGRQAEARAAWAAGGRAYPYFVSFALRQAVADAGQHAAARAARDSDLPIDTDLSHLASITGSRYRLDLVGGTLFGPGPLTDQALPAGGLQNLALARPLTGFIPEMNNFTAEPHLPGEIAVGKPLDGRFSDGTPVNKNVDVGHVLLMNGKFRLFLAALDGGPNHGVVHFYLDRFWNWTIQDDIGIDPGFPAGVIKFENFTFSSSPRLLPASTQTQNSEPAGVDRAGSVASGAVVPGLLGDDAGEGRLSGTFNAIGSFPLDSVILPGAPFAQTRVFRTDIPVTPELAGFLTLANAVSYLRVAEAAGEAASPAEGDRLEAVFRDRVGRAIRHFERAGEWRGAGDAAAEAAYTRLTAPPAPFRRADYVCAADADLAILADRLGIVRSDRDGSRLAGLVRCKTP